MLMPPKLTISLLPDELVVCRLPADATPPAVVAGPLPGIQGEPPSRWVRSPMAPGLRRPHDGSDTARHADLA
jgi:hypothetical protein